MAVGYTGTVEAVGYTLPLWAWKLGRSGRGNMAAPGVETLPLWAWEQELIGNRRGGWIHGNRRGGWIYIAALGVIE